MTYLICVVVCILRAIWIPCNESIQSAGMWGQLEGAGKKTESLERDTVCCFKMHKDMLSHCTGDSPKQAWGRWGLRTRFCCASERVWEESARIPKNSGDQIKDIPPPWKSVDFPGELWWKLVGLPPFGAKFPASGRKADDLTPEQVLRCQIADFGGGSHFVCVCVCVCVCVRVCTLCTRLTRFLGKWSNLTNVFQMGWNHQPADYSLYYYT